jgi:hypothetical protein
VRREERLWELTPSRPWPAGRYAIVVDPVLEDLAGNNLRRPFDREAAAPLAVAPAELTLRFECREAGGR